MHEWAERRKKILLAGVGVCLVGCSPFPIVFVSGEYEDIDTAETREVAKEKCEQIQPVAWPQYWGIVSDDEKGNLLKYRCLARKPPIDANTMLGGVIRATIGLY